MSDIDSDDPDYYHHLNESVRMRSSIAPDNLGNIYGDGVNPDMYTIHVLADT
jgi:hypothetical protein